MILYRRVDRAEAEAIFERGFEDRAGEYMTGTIHRGVFVSDVPLDCNEGAWGDVLVEIAVDMPESALGEWEWEEEGKPYREWQIPAKILNAHARVRVIE